MIEKFIRRTYLRSFVVEQKGMRRIKEFLLFLLDNGPSILTVLFAAFFALRSWQGYISQDRMLSWMLTLLALMAGSELIERFRRLTRIEQSSRDARDLLTAFVSEQANIRHLGIRTLYPTRDFSRVASLVTSVSGQIWLLGSTAYMTLNLIRVPLVDTLVKTNCDLRVLLSARDSQFLKEKEDEERIPGKSQAEVDASLGILKEIIEEVKPRGYTGTIEVRQYRRIAYYSLYLFDRRVAVCSLYSFGRRSVELPMLEVDSVSGGVAGTLFRVYDEHYRHLWDDNRTVVALNYQGMADKGMADSQLSLR